MAEARTLHVAFATALWPVRTKDRENAVHPDQAEQSTIALLRRELSLAQGALVEPGAGAITDLECRVAHLQERMLSTPAQSLADIAARLQVARDIILSLGPRGYLLDLIETCIADLQEPVAGEPGERTTLEAAAPAGNAKTAGPFVPKYGASLR